MPAAPGWDHCQLLYPFASYAEQHCAKCVYFWDFTKKSNIHTCLRANAAYEENVKAAQKGNAAAEAA